MATLALDAQLDVPNKLPVNEPVNEPVALSNVPSQVKLGTPPKEVLLLLY